MARNGMCVAWRKVLKFTSERAQEFYSVVYGSRAGQFRTQSILDDLAPSLEKCPPKVVFDIGGGHAPISLELVEKYGAQAVIVEPSAEMVQRLENHAKLREILSDRYKIVQKPFEEWSFEHEVALHGSDSQLILCHGVLGWVKDPDAFLTRLVDFALKINAPLSLLVGQLGGHLATAALKGQYQEVETMLSTYNNGSPSTSSGVRLFNSHELHQRLAARMKVGLLKGVRVISDLCPENSDEEWLSGCEQRARQIPELLGTANMVHLLALPKSVLVTGNL